MQAQSRHEPGPVKDAECALADVAGAGPRTTIVSVLALQMIAQMRARLKRKAIGSVPGSSAPGS
jgi:hypothetical protein